VFDDSIVERTCCATLGLELIIPARAPAVAALSSTALVENTRTAVRRSKTAATTEIGRGPI
jgi:hypothetical protein